MDPFLSIVIPVYNSRPSLPELYQRLTEVLEKTNYLYEIIMVDDQSQDDSYDFMQQLRRADRRVNIIRLQRNFGQHAATWCGFHYCRGQIIVTLDDDLQNPPEEIPRLLARFEEGYEAVFGIPINKQHPLYRNWGSRLMRNVLASIFPAARGIYSSSYRVLSRDLLERMLKHKPAQIYLAALIFAETQRLANLTVQHDRRKYGTSNYNMLKSMRLAWALWLYYRTGQKNDISGTQPYVIAELDIEAGEIQ